MPKDRRPRPYTRGEFYLNSPTLVPERISGLLGLQPDGAWRMGERYHSKRAAKTGGWMIESGIPDGQPLAEHADAILTKLRPAKEALLGIRSEVKRCNLVLTIGCNREHVAVAWDTLPARILGELHELAIDLEITVIRDVDSIYE